MTAGGVRAADQNGKLWIERTSPAIKKIKKPIVKKRPTPQIRAFKRPEIAKPVERFQPAPVDSSREYQTGSSPNGVDRSPLAPMRNAPVDKYYGGKSRQYGGKSRQYGVKSRFQQGSLPMGLWRDMSFEHFRDAVLKLRGTGGSRVLNNLMVQAMLDQGSMPKNADRESYDLLKMVVLYRLGRIKELTDLIAGLPQNARTLPVRVFEARAFLASGKSEQACALATTFPVGDPTLSPDLLSEALMMTALCAARKKDLQTMGLMADLARDKGIRSKLTYAVIDYLIAGVKPSFEMPQRLGVRDYFFLQLTKAKAKVPRDFLDLAEPPLVYAIAFDRASAPTLRLQAAEHGASRGQISAFDLAAIYQEIAPLGSTGGQGRSDAQTRALLFAGLSRTNDPRHQAKIIDTLLTNARTLHLSGVMGPLLAPFVKQMQPNKELDWFAMRAVEVALLARDMPLAERWFMFVKQGGRGAYAAAEWLPLTDFVQKNVVPAGEGAQMALRMAKARRLHGQALHGLTSVLDALSFRVPIPLWNLAGKQPQPVKGALPPTGVLGQLKKASDEGRAGEVLLIALRVVGPHFADQMHLIALGDIVRALKKAGFTRQAGLFGFNALHRIWPTGQRRQR